MRLAAVPLPVMKGKSRQPDLPLLRRGVGATLVVFERINFQIVKICRALGYGRIFLYIIA
jgi:hypothetical protein